MQGLSPFIRTTLSAPVIDKLISSTLTKTYNNTFYKKTLTIQISVLRKEGKMIVLPLSLIARGKLSKTLTFWRCTVSNFETDG